MYSHQPSAYTCPFCRVVGGREPPETSGGTRQRDVVVRAPRATAFVASKWWPNNPGHVLVVPNVHFENIFDLPVAYAAEIHSVAQQVALAMKAVYRCDGISTRQHNEPAGQQDVWHYHLHVYPRYTGDELYTTRGAPSDPEARAVYAARLRDWCAHASEDFSDEAGATNGGRRPGLHD